MLISNLLIGLHVFVVPGADPRGAAAVEQGQAAWPARLAVAAAVRPCSGGQETATFHSRLTTYLSHPVSWC
jgi:hypothetical protein